MSAASVAGTCLVLALLAACVGVCLVLIVATPPVDPRDSEEEH